MRAAAIDPGLLRTEFSLQRATTAGDGMGGHTESWSEATKVLGRIEPVGAATRFAADQSEETVTHRITLRWRDDLRSGMRLVRDGRSFEVLTVHDPDETGRYLECRTREKGR